MAQVPVQNSFWAVPLRILVNSHSVKYQLSTGPIRPSSHDVPLGCPSPLSNQTPTHTTPSTPQQAARHSNNTSCNVTPWTVPPNSTSRQCYAKVHQGYATVTQGYASPITGMSCAWSLARLGSLEQAYPIMFECDMAFL